jgi:hypothetical protein
MCENNQSPCACAGGGHTAREMDNLCVLPSVKRLVEFLRKDIPGCNDGACDACNRVRKDRGEKPWVRKDDKNKVFTSRQLLPLHYDHYGPLLYMAAVLPESWCIMGITGLRLIRKCLLGGCIKESEKESLNRDCPHLFRILIASQPEGHVRGSSYEFEPDFLPFLHDLYCTQFLMNFPEANLRRPLEGEALAEIPSQTPVQPPPPTGYATLQVVGMTLKPRPSTPSPKSKPDQVLYEPSALLYVTTAFNLLFPDLSVSKEVKMTLLTPINGSASPKWQEERKKAEDKYRLKRDDMFPFHETVQEVFRDAKW